MNPAPSPVFYEPPLAAKPQLREKPHQGLPSKNPAPNQGPNLCNFTVTLGLRATVVENGIGQTYRARYYNSATGRFLSVDPEAGSGQRRYEYAAADPINGEDPTGDEAIVEWALLTMYPSRLPFVSVYFPSWCGFSGSAALRVCEGGGGGGVGGGGGGAPGGPPGPPQRCSGPKCRPRHVVKEDFPAGPIHTYALVYKEFKEREVWYRAYDLNSDDTLGPRDTNDTTSLLETSVTGSDEGICKPGVCPGDGPVFVDTQRVQRGHPYTIRRFWSVAGVQVPVWNLDTSKPVPFEILKLDYDAKPPFLLTYGP